MSVNNPANDFALQLLLFSNSQSICATVPLVQGPRILFGGFAARVYPAGELTLSNGNVTGTASAIFSEPQYALLGLLPPITTEFWGTSISLDSHE